MNVDSTGYTRIEYERRFLVREDSNWREFVEPASRTLEDKYLRGTRLRLRVVTDSKSLECIVKLTKKADSPSAYFRTISRILLTNAEHRVFDAIDGDRLVKTRYRCTYERRTYAVDVFDGALDGLILCEVEAQSLDDLQRARPPDFVGCEVTEDPFFTGASLSRIVRKDLLAKLASLRDP